MGYKKREGKEQRTFRGGQGGGLVNVLIRMSTHRDTFAAEDLVHKEINMSKKR
jgi:hypothetical protein